MSQSRLRGLQRDLRSFQSDLRGYERELDRLQRQRDRLDDQRYEESQNGNARREEEIQGLIQDIEEVDIADVLQNIREVETEITNLEAEIEEEEAAIQEAEDERRYGSAGDRSSGGGGKFYQRY